MCLYIDVLSLYFQVALLLDLEYFYIIVIIVFYWIITDINIGVFLMLCIFKNEKSFSMKRELGDILFQLPVSSSSAHQFCIKFVTRKIYL